MTDFHFGLAADQHSISTYNTDGLLNALGKGLVIAESPHGSSSALNNSEEKLQQKEVSHFERRRPINSIKNKECKRRQAASCLRTAQNVELQPSQAEGLVGLRRIKGLHVYP